MVVSQRPAACATSTQADITATFCGSRLVASEATTNAISKSPVLQRTLAQISRRSVVGRVERNHLTVAQFGVVPLLSRGIQFSQFSNPGLLRRRGLDGGFIEPAGQLELLPRLPETRHVYLLPRGSGQASGRLDGVIGLQGRRRPFGREPV